MQYFKIALLIFGGLFFTFHYNLQAQTFSQRDFERLLKNNKQYADCIGLIGKNQRIDFHNIDLSSINSENASYVAEITRIESERDQLSLSLQNNEDEEDVVWEKIASFDARIKFLKERISENEKLADKGYSDKLSEFIERVDLLVADTVFQVYDKSKVIFNKLPRYSFNPAFLKNISLRKFWDTGKTEDIEQYLRHAYSISMMFNKSDKILVYDNNKYSSDNFATLSYSKLLALHPKMLLFDFNRFGFYKVDNLGSVTNFQEVFRNLPKFSVAIENELENVKKEILKSRLDRLQKITELKSSNSSDVSADIDIINEEFATLESSLIAKREYLLLKQTNADITEPSESRTILNQIECDIYDILKEICEKDNISAVINNSYPERIYYYKPLSRGNEYNSIVNYTTEKINSILCDKTFTRESLRGKSNFVDLLDFLEVVLHKRTAYSLNIENSPIVSYRGKIRSLDSEILEKLYKKYQLDSSKMADVIKD